MNYFKRKLDAWKRIFSGGVNDIFSTLLATIMLVAVGTGLVFGYLYMVVIVFEYNEVLGSILIIFPMTWTILDWITHLLNFILEKLTNEKESLEKSYHQDMTDNKKVYVVAGSISEYIDFVRENFWWMNNSEYLSNVEQLKGMKDFDYALVGNYNNNMKGPILEEIAARGGHLIYVTSVC